MNLMILESLTSHLEQSLTNLRDHEFWFFYPPALDKPNNFLS